MKTNGSNYLQLIAKSIFYRLIQKTMTLKEKLRQELTGHLSDEKTEVDVNIATRIAEEFAIGFAEWLSKKERTNFQLLSYCKKTIMWFTSKNGTGATTKELLEIYKKEQGL